MRPSKVIGTSGPTTAAICSSRLSSGANWSMRAASTACTVSGMPGASNLLPALVRASSSRKNGLPCALVTMRFSAASVSVNDRRTHRTTAALSSAVSRGRASWVADDCCNQGAREPGL